MQPLLLRNRIRGSEACRCCALLLLWIVLSPLPVPAQEKWVVSERIGHLEIYSEWSLDRAELQRELNDVERELTQLLDIPAPKSPVQMILFQNRRNYLAYLSQRLPESRSRVALFYQNGDTSQIYAVRGPSLVTDLRHEYTHVVLHQHLPFIPLWLDEGLAEYFEVRAHERLKSERAIATRWKSRLGRRPSVTDLEGLRKPLEMNNDDYSGSWAWVCFLLNSTDGNRQILRDYLHTIAGGEAPGRFSRFAAGFSTSLEADFATYFRSPQIRLISNPVP